METLTLDWVLDEAKIDKTVEAIPQFISEEPSYQNDVWTKAIERREIRARVTDTQLEKILDNLSRTVYLSYGNSTYTVWLAKCEARYVPHKDRQWLVTLDVYILS